jgi:hypothetical protein
MMVCKILSALVAAMILLSGLSTSSQARIRCNGAFQVVRGAGEIATPYCEDQYLAKVAGKYGSEFPDHKSGGAQIAKKKSAR